MNTKLLVNILEPTPTDIQPTGSTKVVPIRNIPVFFFKILYNEELRVKSIVFFEYFLSFRIDSNMLQIES